MIASPTKKVLRTVVHDFEGWDTYTEKPGYQIESNIAFADVDPIQYDGLIIPGGRAPEYIRLDENIPRIVSHFFDAEKPVGAICHAALVLTMTAYTACSLDVENLGATYTTDTLHVDGNIVSGHAWPDLPGFMREFLSLVKKQ